VSVAGDSVDLSVLDVELPLALVIALAVLDVAIRAFAVVVVPGDRRPSSATAWLLAIFFVPYLGILAFLLIGNPKLPRERMAKQQRINELILERTEGMDRALDDQPWPPWVASLVRLNRTLGSMPLVRGNSIDLLTDYEESIAAMAAEVDGARDYVHAEFYILASDATSAVFLDALERAVQRGVVVRVLLDHLGSARSPGYRATTRHLDRIGVQWHLMLPVQPLRGRFQRPDLRNHRKLLVVDGAVAFTGSQNMVDRSYGKRSNRRRGLQWQDVVARCEGPVVNALDAVFVSDWYSETDELLAAETGPAPGPELGRTLECQVVPSGPGFESENNLRLFNALVYSAEHRIGMTTPYFVPDESLLYAITTAAQRGVEVDLFLSEVADQRLVQHAQQSYYDALLRAGVRIHLYRGPRLLHAKHLTIDDDVAVLGSSNMDMRSFQLNLEVSLMVVGASFVKDLRAVEDDYRTHAYELTLRAWRQRPWRSRVVDNLARLTSALQ
jgi:cardiolipin synthase